MRRSADQIGLGIRVGLHTGEVEFVGPDARGVAVHAAARVMSFAGPGEVLMSSTTKDLLEGSGLILEDAGVHRLKGLPGERRLFKLADSGGLRFSSAPAVDGIGRRLLQVATSSLPGRIRAKA